MFSFQYSLFSKNPRQIKLKSKFLVFLFPFYPLKLMRTINLMTVYALLFGLRLGLGFLNIKLTGVNTTISFAWLPLMVLGWYFGPVIGFFSGFLTDTVGFLIRPAVWFWMYAIQEPIVGLVAGLLGSIATLRKNTTRPIVDLLVSQILYMLFIVFTFVIIIELISPNASVFKYHNNRKSQFSLEDNFVNTFKYLALGFLIFFFLITEFFVLIYYFKNRKNPKKHLVYLIYGSMLVLFSTLVFSFALGPITSVKYLEYIGRKATLYLKYGANYYLLPRIIKESVKTPVYIILFTSIVFSFDYIFVNVKNIAKHKWIRPLFNLNNKIRIKNN
ncbi:ECF transporter S component [Ureaplasma sp. ES3154-GEN]|uniref:ECF transporter S component n=1 Tax=Ureaplasma sp. ES3154-GEN TaxID=2984844 RepID=UPI0021E97520|nr:ECF transporter S component [Ureaplasma sp. ES3154-GEN]MCV3743332.1 ECF transporter S component [Ureaplasma sp. ES3154-GEN]